MFYVQDVHISKYVNYFMYLIYEIFTTELNMIICKLYKHIMLWYVYYPRNELKSSKWQQGNFLVCLV